MSRMVKVTDKYYIDVIDSPVSYVLKRKFLTKKGEDRFKCLGYYSSVEGALSALADQVVADDLAPLSCTLSEALAHIDARRSELMQVIKEAIPN